MNKTELVKMVAETAEISQKDAGKAVAALVETVTEALKKDDKVQIIGFGTFELKKRPARKVRNPQTGKQMKVKASNAPSFKAGKSFKDAVNP